MLGMSAQAIASHSGRDYPHDPSDLLRCIDYCRGRFDTSALQKRMAGRSVEWDRLLPHWDHLAELLQHEIDTRTDRRAPATYMAMRQILAGGTPCETCESTGRGDVCEKCNGSGRRAGGRCRAERCYGGADFCPTCRGRGHMGGDR